MKKITIVFILLIFATTLHAGWWKKFKKSLKKKWKTAGQKSNTRTSGVSTSNFWGVLSAKAGDSMSSKYGLYMDSSANTRVRTIGHRIARQSRKNYDYRFGILNTSMVNAFAFPNGQIYVTKGLLDMVESDDELACVLGHECAHVRNRDSEKALLKNMFFLGSMQAILGNSSSSKYKWMTLVSSLTMLKLSRTDEYEADYTGMEYAHSAGYDPGGMSKFLRKLKQKEGSSSAISRGLLKFVSTHPPTNTRIARTLSTVKELNNRRI